MAEPAVVIEAPDQLLANAPITVLYHLTTELTVETSVVGEALNIANITVKAGSIDSWAGTLTQILPSAATTFPITVGNVTIKQGAKFRMTVPTPGPEGQPGQVYLECMIEAQGVEQPFSARIATWTLS